MILGAVTLTLSNLVLQILVGAIAAGVTGRAMRGTGFGILGDLLFGVIGAIGANFVVSYSACSTQVTTAWWVSRSSPPLPRFSWS